MKKVFSLVLVISLLFTMFSGLSVTSNAAATPLSGKLGENITYSLNKSTGVLTVSGNGEMYNYDYRDEDNQSPITSLQYDLNEEDRFITKVIIQSGITRIGDGTFYNLYNLKSVEIPNTVTAIGDCAFFGCWNELNNVVVPSSVTEIGIAAFNQCGNLTNITLPNTLTHIGHFAFYSTGYTNDSANAYNGGYYINNYLVKIDLSTSGKFTVKSGTILIGDYVLYEFSFGTKKINEVILNDGLKYVGEYAISSGFVQKVTIPQSVIGFAHNYFSDSAVITYKNTSENWLKIRGDITAPYTVICTDGTFINNEIQHKHTVVTDAAVAATCTKSGLSAGSHCSVCGEVLQQQTVIKALGHNYKKTVIAPTCTKQGYTVNTCTRCNSTYNSNYVPASHSWNSGVVTTPATTKTEGVRTYTCTACGATKNEPIPVIPENVQKGMCGPNVKYAYYPDTKELFISGTGKMDSYKRIERLPLSGEDIEKYADWSYYETVVLHPESYNHVYKDSYLDTVWKDVECVTIEKGVTTIGDGAFHDCKKLQSISIADSVIVIGNSAFLNCTSLIDISLPDSVEGIGAGAFANCSNLQTISIGKGLNSIGLYDPDEGEYFVARGNVYYSFTGCTNLKTIKVDTANQTYESSANYDMLFFNENEKELVFVLNAASVTVPEGVTDIDSYAFYLCDLLKSVALPNSLQSIETDAFSHCTRLDTIHLSTQNLSYIGENAFNDTAYYKNKNNWKENVLYIGEALIKANKSCPSDYAVSNGTKVIAQYAFIDAANLVCLTLPNSVKLSKYYNEINSNCQILRLYNADKVYFYESDLPMLREVYYIGNSTATAKIITNEDEVYDIQTYHVSASHTKHTFYNTAYLPYDSTNGFTGDLCHTCGLLKNVTEIIYALDHYSAKTNYLSKTSFSYTAKVIKPTAIIKAGGKTLKQNVDYKLTYQTNCKNVGTHKVKIQFIGDYENYPALINTFKIELAKPKVKVSSVGLNSFKLSWNKVPGAKYYRIYQYSQKTGYKRLANIKGTSYSFSKKTDGTVYYYLVRAYFFNAAKKEVLSPYTTADNVRVATLCKAPAAKASVSGKSINLKWNKIKGASYYIIYSYNTKTGRYSFVEKNVLTNAYTIKNVKKGTYYYLVRAFNVNELGSKYSKSNHVKATVK